MFNNYLKIALRNLRRNKFYSLINLSGLALGMSSFILLLLFLFHELSYDRFHKNADRMYRVCLKGRMSEAGREINQAITPSPLSQALIDEFPEIETVTKFDPTGDIVVQYKDRKFNQQDVLYAESNFFNFFSFDLLEGNPETVLKDPYSIVLTKQAAQKYFGDKSPVGKILTIFNNPYKVTGIASDTPRNSHFNFEMIISLSSKKKVRGTWISDMYFYTYITLKDKSYSSELEKKFPTMIKKYVGTSMQQTFNFSFEQFEKHGGHYTLYLQPITQIHLHSHLEREIDDNGSAKNIYIFSAIALFIIIIACINFVNLITTISARRAREIGIRKVAGCQKRQLIGQFLTESVSFSFLAMLLAIILIELFLGFFNEISGKSLTINFVRQPWLIILFSGLPFVIGLCAGIYPAFYLTSLKPVESLKANINNHQKGSRMRARLVILQFIISIGLIISTILIYKQTQFMKNKNPGFEKENIVVIPDAYKLGRNKHAFKQSLIEHSRIINASISSGVPTRSYSFHPIRAEAAVNQDFFVYSIVADENFIDTYKIKIIDGKSFSSEFPYQPGCVLINETAARVIDWDKPIGKYLTIPAENVKFKVIGVVKDFNFESLHNEIKPFVIFLSNKGGSNISARIQPGDINRTIKVLAKQWKIYASDQPFDYFFFDERINNLYYEERRLGKIFVVFTVLAIVIACLGLTGLVAYITETRTKEIGIRKVLGAAVPGIVLLLTKEFTKWVLIANIIAWPVAYYFMNKWLQNFAYRINIGIWTFLFAGALALLIALLTVSHQAIRAAMANPVDSLRYE